MRGSLDGGDFSYDGEETWSDTPYRFESASYAIFPAGGTSLHRKVSKLYVTDA